MNEATLITFKPEFKKEWNEYETRGVKSYLNEWLEENYFHINSDAENYFGLAYTSSSDYAMLNVCSGEGARRGNFIIDPENESLIVDCFALTDNNILIAVCSDYDNNEYYYRID